MNCVFKALFALNVSLWRRYLGTAISEIINKVVLILKRIPTKSCVVKLPNILIT